MSQELSTVTITYTSYIFYRYKRLLPACSIHYLIGQELTSGMYYALSKGYKRLLPAGSIRYLNTTLYVYALSKSKKSLLPAYNTNCLKLQIMCHAYSQVIESCKSSLPMHITHCQTTTTKPYPS